MEQVEAKTIAPTEQPAQECVERIEIETIEHVPRNTLMLLSVKTPLACRLLIKDLSALLPNNVMRDSKIKENFSLSEVSELAEVNDSDNVFLIETRRKAPAPILWTATRVVDAESKKESWDVVKFILTGVYTMKELKFLGNPLGDTQMATLFSAEFENSSGLRRIRRMLTNIFNTTTAGVAEPVATKDYVDKLASFFLVEGRIFARFYHLSKKTAETEKIQLERRRAESEQPKNGSDDEGEPAAAAPQGATDPNVQLDGNEAPWIEVTEIGPRFTLHPRESDLDDTYQAPVDQDPEANE